MDETAQNLQAAATADAIQLLIDTAAIRRLLAQPHPAERPGHRYAGPTLLHHGRPQASIAVTGPAHHRHVAAIVQQARGRIPQSHLVRRQVEVHRPAS